MNFWMCYVEGKHAPAHKHLEWDTAQKEAERLAVLPDNLKRKVFVLRAVALCEVSSPPVEWTTLWKEGG